MPDYTIELNEVIDLDGDIGLCHYPIFDEEYRDCLNHKIIQHFWNREIGMESISMFRQQLRRKMNEIMPYWNQHYLASQIKFDPLKTVSMKTIGDTTGTTDTAGTSTGEQNVSGEGTSTSGSDSKSRAVASNFPQMMLSDTGDYADTGQDNIANTTANGATTESQATNSTGTETQKTTNTGNVESETSGYSGSAAVLIAEYRATFVNTDMDVINQLEPLFMGIWGTTDDQFDNERGSYYGNGYYYRGFAF